MVQTMVSKAYDLGAVEGARAGSETGYRSGFTDGVKRGVEECKNELAESYNRGSSDAIHWGTSLFLGFMCVALNKTRGFGKKRLQPLIDDIGYAIQTTIDVTEVIEKCREIGVQIDFDDYLSVAFKSE